MALAVRERPGVVRLGVQGVSIEAAIDRLVDAAQGVVENQLELARLELEATLHRFLRRAVLAALGVLLLAGAGVSLAMTGYEVFPPEVPAVARLAVLTGVTVVVAAVCLVLGLRRGNGRGR